MNVYIAAPFWTKQERENVNFLKQVLQDCYSNVYVPMEHKVPNGESMPNDEWAEKVYKADIEAIEKADKVFAIIYGMQDDAGTAFEIGYAVAKGIPVTLVKRDQGPYSLMVMTGAQDETRKDYKQK